MWVVIPFYDTSGPVEGLSPIIKIRDVDTDILIVSGTMTEVADGFYCYDFTLYDITKRYTIFGDAVSLDDQYRYKFLTTGSHGTQINNIYLSTNNADIRVEVLKKLLINRLELADGNSDNMILYEDDDITPRFTYSVTDKVDSGVVQISHIVSRRSKGV